MSGANIAGSDNLDFQKSKKPILVTGGGGYVGSHMIKYLLEKEKSVAAVDNFVTGFREPLKILSDLGVGELQYFDVDLTDKKALEKVFDQFEFEHVLHFASLCLVNESMEEPYRYFFNNVVGSLNLTECMVDHEVENIVFSSTCAVYGDSKYLPIDEKHPKTPTNPYAESKLMIENIIKWYSQLYNINYIIFRYFNPCGADKEGLIGYSKKPSSHLMENAVRGALGIAPFELTCAKVDTPDGTPIRDYINIEDLVRAHYLACDYLSKGRKSEEINLGTGRGYSVKEIVDEVSTVSGVRIESKQGEQRKGEFNKVYASLDKAKKLLSWEPQKTLNDSIVSCLNWYKNNPNGFDK